VRYHDFAGQAWAEGNGSLHRDAIRGLRRGNGLYIWAMPLVMIYLGRIRVLNKQKKKKKKIHIYGYPTPLTSYGAGSSENH